jgi:nucleoside-diphosphate-sugar epimerase
MSDVVVVAGAGGFIGGHLTAELARQGARVRAVDAKPVEEWYQVPEGVEVLRLDLQEKGACYDALDSASAVYNLAADMGAHQHAPAPRVA